MYYNRLIFSRFFYAALVCAMMAGCLQSDAQKRILMAPVSEGGGGGGGNSEILTPSKRLADRIRSGAYPALPTSIQDLGELDTNTYELTVDEAASLQIPFVGGTDAKVSRKIFVRNFIMYKRITEGDAEVWYGVGVRWILNAKSLNANAKLTPSVSGLAAAGELKTAEVQATLEIRGLNSGDITAATKASQKQFNVESFVQMQQAFDQIVDVMSDAQKKAATGAPNPSLKILPVIVQQKALVSASTDDQLLGILYSAWALAGVSEGKTLQQAVDSYPGATPDKAASIMAAMKSIYFDLLNTDQPDKRPDDLQRVRAKQLVGNLKLKK